MRIQLKLGAAVAAFVLGCAPALAIAAHPNNGKHGSQSRRQDVREALQQGEQEARRRLDGDPVLAVHRRDEQGSVRQGELARSGLQGHEQEARRRHEGHALQPVCRRGRPSAWR